MKKILFLCFFLSFIYSQAQIVSIEPAFFTQTSDITVSFDASQGNGGLEGVTQVYMHTGLITESGGPGNWQHVQGNWGTDDPKVKMTYTGGTKHTLSFNIEEFYDIEGQSITVNQLAFVFRNVDGSKEGKTASLSDIFVDIPESGVFSGFFVTPSNNFIIREIGETIEVKAVFSDTADLKLYDNNNLLDETNGTEIIHSIQIIEAGNHIVRFEANNGETTIIDSFSYVVNPTINIQNPPEGTDLGLTRISESEVRLSLYAPEKEYVYVVGSFTDWKLNTNYIMNRSADTRTWWIDIPNLNKDETYTYQYYVSDNIIIGDPFSELILDTNDERIPAENYPNIPEYPLGLTNGRVSVFKTVKEEFDWTVDNFEKPEKEKLIVYELLLRDFLENSNYQTLMDTLNYIKNLGINAIELMPVQEYEKNKSWGYNPSYHMALDKYYGTATAFKAFIDKAHEMGIAVILDVVYNHAFGQSPLVQLYWDGQNNRPAANSPYFNEEARHLYNVGFDFNHESQATKAFVKRVTSYWIEEFRVDGFRFDLSKGFTQNLSTTDEQMSAYDQSRINILNDYADHIWSIEPEFYVILEHFAENSEHKVLSSDGMMIWGNANYNFNEATMGYHTGGKSDFRWISYKNVSWENPYLLTFMESHDEERIMYKNLEYGNIEGDYSVKQLNTALERVKMAAPFLLLVPGPKMIWQFGELGYDFSINRCTDGTIDEYCRLSPKPIRWDYFEETDRRRLYNTISRFNFLKRTEDIFSTDDFEMGVSGALKKIRFNSDNGNAILIGNFDVVPGSINPTFQHTGKWYDFISGDSITVTDVNAEINLNPGQYYLYLDKTVDFTSPVTEINYPDKFNFSVYPNPASDFINIQITSNKKNFVTIQLFNMDGRALIKKNNEAINPGVNVVHIDMNGELRAGLYFLSISDGHTIQTEKIMIQE